MAENEDGAEKTEDASSKKLDEARNKGNLPRSKDLSSALLLLIAAASLYATGSLLAQDMSNIFEFNFVLSRADMFDVSKMVIHLSDSSIAMMDSLIVMMIVLAIAGIVGSVALGGFNFSWEPVIPKLSKMNPISGLKRMFSLNSLVELLKSIAKVSLVLIVAFFVLKIYLPEMLLVPFQSLELALEHAINVVIWAFVYVSLAVLLIAAVDVPYQAWTHKDKLKMTKQETKDEYKNAEGDPQIKARIRQAQRQASMRRMMEDVPSADVIITNPTHFSVALKYEAGAKGAPKLLAKGNDFVALKIREIGAFHNIPVIQSPVLARSIYHHTDIGEEIPTGLFQSVAQILAYVYQLKQSRLFGAKAPDGVPNVDVPQEFHWDGEY
ncbi:flagellar biosynthesis protein FlhB [Marinomonas sp. PE14-40]|uniref:flagellar biosynthesis protein FlhB n=1 Tax=Marinomonas sp. PE14-40 TaxID=3060621 RepID=UPI003F662B8C